MKNVRIVSRDFDLTLPIANRVERRVRDVQVRRGRTGLDVRAVVGEVRGPRGGADKYCQMVARLPEGTVTVEHRHENLYVAIDQCARRLDRAVGSQVGRARDRRRRDGRAA